MTHPRDRCIDLAGGPVYFIDGFDDAIIGVGEQAGRPPVVVYDTDKAIAIIMKNQDCDDDEAWNYLLFSKGSWVGDSPPIFLSLIGNDEET